MVGLSGMRTRVAGEHRQEDGPVVRHVRTNAIGTAHARIIIGFRRRCFRLALSTLTLLPAASLTS